MQYGDGAGNVVEENSSIFSVIGMHYLPSSRPTGKKASACGSGVGWTPARRNSSNKANRQ